MSDYVERMISMFEQLKKFCDSFLELGVPGFDLVIYKDGECILRYMNGYSDLENKVKMNGNERYNSIPVLRLSLVQQLYSCWKRGCFRLKINFPTICLNSRK